MFNSNMRYFYVNDDIQNKHRFFILMFRVIKPIHCVISVIIASVTAAMSFVISIF